MLTYLIHSIVSLFAVMNPFGILPTFLALTNTYSPPEQRQIARKAILNSFVILLVFLLLGNVILNLFSITINAFRVAGGILLFGIAYDLLHAKLSPIQSPYNKESRPTQDITMTPLALPIIAGPGTITTVMALAADPQAVSASIAVFVAFVLVLIATYIIFYYAAAINKRLGQERLNVITRLMGFVLSIIAIQMAATGLAGLFPAWVHG